jgi:hypothetical protein
MAKRYHGASLAIPYIVKPDEVFIVGDNRCTS